MLLDNKKLLMVQDFITDYNIKLTASQIAKKYSLNQKSVYLFMESLEKRHIIKSEFQGKNKLYSLNKDNKEIVIQFLCAIEHSRTFHFYQKHSNLKIIFEKIIPNTNGIVAVFGSYAKGNEKESSDLDVYISGSYSESKIKDVINTYDIDINIKYQKKFTKDTLTLEVKKNHIIIKNVEQFVRETYLWIS
jgi:uncharacterized protein